METGGPRQAVGRRVSGSPLQMIQPGYLLALSFLAAVGYFVVLWSGGFSRRPKGTKNLPGPKGNLLQIQSQHSWLQFRTWADNYGPIFCLKLGLREHVVISSEAIANDLLRERGNIYSSREEVPMAAELLSHNLRPLLLPYSDRWRRVRKFMHQLTMPRVATTYEPSQSLESKRLVYNLLRDPTNIALHLQLYSGGLIFRIGYGKRLKSHDEPFLRRIIQVNHNLERIASPGSYLVDTIPLLKHLPTWIAPFKQEAARLHAEEWAIHRDPKLYPDPETFNPTRWLSEEFPTYNEPLSKFPNLQNFTAFGSGRRICPGINIAERSLYILTARIAWACKISKKRDSAGHEIPVPLYDYTVGFNTEPNPWSCELVARSKEREEAIVKAWEEAMSSDPLSS
ncbi:cytochrome P450 [Cadophora sp. DSE1049]|nr:cytochrome P450 [Cadophora sp. DSE1049]